MTVTAQYAAEHLPELLSAVDRGESVVIQRDNKPPLQITARDAAYANVRPVTTESRAALFNSWRGKMFLADDWNSPETNATIAAEFEASDDDEELFGTFLKRQA